MTERLVEDYLAAVARACSDLPAPLRLELMADLREHIAVARAELPEQTEAGVRAILHRLGDPVAIAAEARASVPMARMPAVAGYAMPPMPPPPMPPPSLSRPMPVRRSSGMGIVVAAAVLVPVTVVVAIFVLGVLFYYGRA